MRWTRIALCAGLFLNGMIVDAGSAEGERSVALVLDASGSMNARLPDGTTRIAAAKTAIEQLLGILAPDTRLSLRVYGHQSSVQKKNCIDSEVVAGFDSVTVNRNLILERTQRIKAQGYTPINYSLQRAAEDISNEEAAERIVVLVSDGKETCEGDPCATAQALAKADARLAVHTIGFGVDTVTRQQLECIARVARGKYFDATNARDLAGVLSRAAETKATEQKRIVVARQTGTLQMNKVGRSIHDIINSDGETVASFNVFTRHVLPVGIYSVRFGKELWTGIEVKANKITKLQPGFLKVNPIGSGFVHVLEPETGQIIEKLYWVDPGATLIPGRYDVQFGKAMWPGGIELKQGEMITIRPAIVKVESNVGLFQFIVKDLQGQELDSGIVMSIPRLALPAGKYILELDPSKSVKAISDDQRMMEIDLVEGQELVITVE